MPDDQINSPRIDEHLRKPAALLHAEDAVKRAVAEEVELRARLTDACEANQKTWTDGERQRQVQREVRDLEKALVSSSERLHAARADLARQRNEFAPKVRAALQPRRAALETSLIAAIAALRRIVDGASAIDDFEARNGLDGAGLGRERLQILRHLVQLADTHLSPGSS